jgi:hypothetical protein
LLVDVRPEPDRETRRDDEEALEEIRRLFARYRQKARHGAVFDRDESAEVPDENLPRAPAASAR